MIPKSIQDDIDELKEGGYSITELEAPDGNVHIIIDKFLIPKGFSREEGRLLIKIPISYPNGKPDMFWIEEPILLEGGGIPQSADIIEQYHKASWRRFSWHSKNWRPGNDNLTTYLEFIEARLNHKK